MKHSVRFSLLIISLAISLFLIFSNHNTEKKPNVKIAGKTIYVNLAITREEQEKGLSGRKSLAEKEGMLFVFDKPGKYPFWMKDMNFPIDIIWLAPSAGGDSEDMRIVYIKKDARPESYPEGYGPGPNDGDAKYVLEVTSGFSYKNHIEVGDRLVFTK